MPDTWEAESPGASGPGDPGYDGEVTVGDEGAVAGPESFVDPSGDSNGEPGQVDERLEGDVPQDLTGGGGG